MDKLFHIVYTIKNKNKSYTKKQFENDLINLMDSLFKTDFINKKNKYALEQIKKLTSEENTTNNIKLIFRLLKYKQKIDKIIYGGTAETLKNFNSILENVNKLKDKWKGHLSNIQKNLNEKTKTPIVKDDYNHNQEFDAELKKFMIKYINIDDKKLEEYKSKILYDKDLEYSISKDKENIKLYDFSNEFNNKLINYKKTTTSFISKVITFHNINSYIKYFIILKKYLYQIKSDVKFYTTFTDFNKFNIFKTDFNKEKFTLFSLLSKSEIISNNNMNIINYIFSKYNHEKEDDNINYSDLFNPNLQINNKNELIEYNYFLQKNINYNLIEDFINLLNYFNNTEIKDFNNKEIIEFVLYYIYNNIVNYIEYYKYYKFYYNPISDLNILINDINQTVEDIFYFYRFYDEMRKIYNDNDINSYDIPSKIKETYNYKTNNGKKIKEKLYDLFNNLINISAINHYDRLFKKFNIAYYKRTVYTQDDYDSLSLNKWNDHFVSIFTRYNKLMNKAYLNIYNNQNIHDYAEMKKYDDILLENKRCIYIYHNNTMKYLLLLDNQNKINNVYRIKKKDVKELYFYITSSDYIFQKITLN